ncbi:MAG: hypothetical protein VXY94_10085 [Planctomycetota bacterium]|nr:hypothetical protein [Planctomycetota bacterium]
MFKFLRQYQGWILAVFGTILLISFLLPQAIQGLSQYAAQTGGDWAKVGDGETVTTGRLQEIQGELRILELASNAFINLLGADKDPAYWYLLSREAEQAGLVGGPGSGEQMAESMALQSNGALTATTLIARFQGTSGFNTQQALQTLAKVQGVGRLTQQFQTAARFSDVRLRNTAAKLALAVDADLVIIDARENGTEDSVDDDRSPIDDATLQAQFDAYKDQLPGTGENGFGYKLEDQARLEWLVVDREQVKEAIAAGAGLDPIEMRKAFLKDPTRFGAIKLEGAEPEFSDYRETVQQVMADEALDERMQAITKFLNDQIQLPRRGLVREDGEFVLPEDWDDQRADYQALAESMVEEFELQQAPVVSGSEGTLTAAQIDEVEGLGKSRSSKFGTRATTASEYVMSAAEFGREDIIPAQVGISSPVFTDLDGNLYLFRATEALPERVPGGLDEVRERVETDVRNIQRFKRLVESLPELKKEAEQSGLQAVADRFGVDIDFQASIAEANPQFLRFGVKSPTRISGLDSSTSVVQQIVERAEQLDYTVPSGDLPASDRIFFVTDEDNLVVVGVQVAAIKPMTQESWRELASSQGLFGIMATEETAGDLLETFSLKALRKRHNFRYVDRETQATAEAEDMASEDPAPGGSGDDQTADATASTEQASS